SARRAMRRSVSTRNGDHALEEGIGPCRRIALHAGERHADLDRYRLADLDAFVERLQAGVQLERAATGSRAHRTPLRRRDGDLPRGVGLAASTRSPGDRAR